MLSIRTATDLSPVMKLWRNIQNSVALYIFLRNVGLLCLFISETTQDVRNPLSK